jgi:hypothetical protein
VHQAAVGAQMQIRDLSDQHPVIPNHR